MAKKSRSHKKSSFKFLSAPFIAGMVVVFIIVGAIYFNMNGSAVKGASTFKPPSAINHPIPVGSESGTKCNARVIAFSISGVCTSNSARDKFTTASYTCSNGATGTITKNCFNAQDAFERANIACLKAAGCLVPSTKPSSTSIGIFKPNTTGTNHF